MTSYRQLEPFVLIVESEITELEKLHQGFLLEGFNVESQSRSEQVIERMKHHRFDVVVVDLMMPGINGLQLARMIREFHPDVVIVLMSSYHLSPIQLAKANVGVAGFVPKPFKISDLAEFIKKKLADAATGAAASKTDKTGLGVPVDISRAV
ncbi:MAG: response regulator [Deltaproteobacteria bacterium]|nr:response regulator [Deltaproteobacteria bacterium]MBN2674622.1 response regulator [Deltaproteobacteria bacterium]